MIKRAFVCLALLVCLHDLSLSAQQPRRKIDFSEPGSQPSTTVSNMNQLDTRKASSAKQSQEQLFKAIGNHQSQGPLDVIGANPYPYVVPNAAPTLDKKALERLEKQKNWAFQDPYDLNAGQPTLEEAMHVKDYGPDGKEKKSESSIDSYFKTLNGTKKNSLDPMKWGDRLPNESMRDITGTNSLRETRMQMLESQSGRPSSLSPLPLGSTIFPQNQPSQWGFAGTLPGSDAASLAAARAQKEHRDELLKLLEPRSGLVESKPANLVGFPNLGLPDNNSVHTPLNPFAPTSINPIQRAPSFDTINARSLGKPDPIEIKPTSGVLTPPPVLMPSTAFPKRKF